MFAFNVSYYFITMNGSIYGGLNVNVIVVSEPELTDPLRLSQMKKLALSSFYYFF